MGKTVVVLEDDRDLMELVRELLEEAGYEVVETTEVKDLLSEAARRSPCVALVDSMNPTEFDLWHLGPTLRQLGVPPVVFSAHSQAREEYEADAQGFVGVVSKPFDTDEFIEVVNAICWEQHQRAAS